MFKDKFRSKPEYERIRTRKDVRTTRRLDEQQECDKEVKIARAAFESKLFDENAYKRLKKALANIRLKN